METQLPGYWYEEPECHTYAGTGPDAQPELEDQAPAAPPGSPDHASGTGAPLALALALAQKWLQQDASKP